MKKIMIIITMIFILSSCGEDNIESNNTKKELKETINLTQGEIKEIGTNILNVNNSYKINELFTGIDGDDYMIATTDNKINLVNISNKKNISNYYKNIVGLSSLNEKDKEIFINDLKKYSINYNILDKLNTEDKLNFFSKYMNIESFIFEINYLKNGLGKINKFYLLKSNNIEKDIINNISLVKNQYNLNLSSDKWNWISLITDFNTTDFVYSNINKNNDEYTIIFRDKDFFKIDSRLNRIVKKDYLYKKLAIYLDIKYSGPSIFEFL